MEGLTYSDDTESRSRTTVRPQREITMSVLESRHAAAARLNSVASTGVDSALYLQGLEPISPGILSV